MTYLYMLISFFFSCQEVKEATTETVSQTMPQEALEQVLEKGPIRTTLRIWPKEPRLGDMIHVELEVFANEGWDVEMPPFGEALGRFQIVDFEPSDKEGDDNTHSYQQHYRLQPLNSGVLRLPSLRVAFQEKGNEEESELLTDEITISVASVLPEGAALELMGPRNKLDQIFGLSQNQQIGIGAVVVLLAIGGLWIVFRKREGTEEILAAHIKAQNALFRLEQHNYQDEKLDIFYQELSMILRRYIEDRFSLRAPEQTTEEFVAEFPEHQYFSAEQEILLERFLRQCDAVKFAGQKDSVSHAQEYLGFVRQFIEKTRERDTKELEGGTNE